MTQQNNSPEVVFSTMGRKYGLYRIRNLPAFTAANAMRKIFASPHQSANYFSNLLQYVKASDLRKLLSDDMQSFNSLDEKQVRIRIDSLLKSGSIVLVEFANGALPGFKPVAKTSSRDMVEDYEYVDHTQTQSSADLAINQPPTAKEVTKSNEPVLDETALIAVLIAAAADGVALCEVCSKKESA